MDEGAERVAWTRANMPPLAALRVEYAEERPYPSASTPSAASSRSTSWVIRWWAATS